MNSRIIICCYLLFSAIAAQAAGDRVTDCRQQHADNPTAHIACLEEALNEFTKTPVAGPTTSEASTVLGSEQVQQKKRASGEVEDQAATVTIVAVRYNSAELGFFKLDNGQIWRETEVTPRHMRLDPSGQYQAVLERGKVGGYRMQVEGIRRMLKVERLK